MQKSDKRWFLKLRYLTDTAFAQNWLDDKWYCYDDIRVSQIEKEDVQVRLYAYVWIANWLFFFS
jgi:hypothetical protein